MLFNCVPGYEVVLFHAKCVTCVAGPSTGVDPKACSILAGGVGPQSAMVSGVLAGHRCSLILTFYYTKMTCLPGTLQHLFRGTQSILRSRIS